MAANETVAEIGKLPTAKSDETLVVRVVKNGGTALKVDVRTFVENERYTGWSKAGIRCDAENAAKLAELLDQALAAVVEHAEATA